MKKLIPLFALLAACGQAAEKSSSNTNEEKEAKTSQVLVPGAVTMLDPLLAENILGSYYFPNPLHADFIRQNKIKNMHFQVYEYNEGAPKDFGVLKGYNFNQNGEVTQYYEVNTEDSKDTTINIYFTYENGHCTGRGPRTEAGTHYVYTYGPRERTETDMTDGEQAGQRIWETDDKGNLVQFTESGMGRHDAYRIKIFYNAEITEKDRMNAAEIHKSDFASEGFLGLDMIQMEKGYPVKNMEIRQDGTVIPQSVTTWEYDDKSRLVKFSAPTMSGMAIHTYTYDAQGKLTSLVQTNGYKIEPLYTFYE